MVENAAHGTNFDKANRMPESEKQQKIYFEIDYKKVKKRLVFSFSAPIILITASNNGPIT